jgi:hypothetical protein
MFLEYTRRFEKSHDLDILTEENITKPFSVYHFHLVC